MDEDAMSVWSGFKLVLGKAAGQRMEKLSALLENTAETIEDADAALVEKVAPSDKAAVQALSLIGEIGDQPPMRALCASIIVFGLIRRDAKLTLAGLRMLTAHTIATKAKNVLKSASTGCARKRAKAKTIIA